jgi:hypothetical protein
MDLLDGVAQETLSANRRLGAGGTNEAARAAVASRSNDLWMRGCVSGKDLLLRLFDWTQREVACLLIRRWWPGVFSRPRFPMKLRQCLGAIENLKPFQS